MPEVFFLAGYSIYFSTLDREHGVHVHVARGSQRDLARFVLHEDRTVTLAHNHGKIPAKHIRLIQAALIRGFDEVVDAWTRLFGEDIHFDR
ncbi:DUF4160 domain-containing protein [Bifidobacterium sp. UTBIF-78]|uniref:DUF4160 domain-containing protein n=1 Tax=Bifidobacterium sp. UTBIF-78 TaxID=1465263 RepID=UPI0015E329B5|nr:DUF4160 domain-containing protein [Bifidobacterium sp. UTBIF-78]TPF93789.1 hypothetical protein BG22_06740 [Bifidobacterium sp. UTBIF-78]